LNKRGYPVDTEAIACCVGRPGITIVALNALIRCDPNVPISVFQQVKHAANQSTFSIKFGPPLRREYRIGRTDLEGVYRKGRCGKEQNDEEDGGSHGKSPTDHSGLDGERLSDCEWFNLFEYLW
jgi:hypothetical protein